MWLSLTQMTRMLCRAVVPGSHRLLEGPRDNGVTFTGGGTTGAALDTMAGARRLAGKAGDAMLADIR